MVFSSLLFLFRFLPIVLLLYFIAPGKLKNLVLFVMSLIFYAWGEPVYVVLMLFSTVVDYTHGKLVDFFIRRDKRTKAKIVVASSVVINLLLLCFFKYSDFLIDNVNAVFNLSIANLNLGLPIGISFYTFQTMSYTIDVYRGDAKVQNNIISFGAYVALFPQLIAGPIVQYKTVDAQMNNRKVTLDGFAYGIGRFMTGLGKKVLLANNIGLLWDSIQSTFISGQAAGGAFGNVSVLTAWIGAAAFAFQIYFDFSGYSDMAIGLGAMFGFRFNENFNYPYESASITEFWRRWHISLGTWFKEYVYIPLGGNRCSRAKNIRNIAIVWMLTGIWHGASWNFLIWGMFFGVLLIIEKFGLKDLLESLPRWCGVVYTLFLVLISWMIFAFDSIGNGIMYIGNMFGIGCDTIVDDMSLYMLLSYGVTFIILILGATSLPKYLGELLFERFGRDSVLMTVLTNLFYIFIFVMSVAFIVDASYNPFLYFRF